MTKRLILIRHAKSSWDAPLDDHARSLNARGRRSALAVGKWLRGQGHVPEAIYSSDAARTAETTALLKEGLEAAPPVAFRSNMYHANPETLMNVLKGAEGDVVALVAHNPGIAYFAEAIVVAAPDHPRFVDYPTCATLVCDFPITTWADASPASAQVVDFIVPRDLLGG